MREVVDPDRRLKETEWPLISAEYGVTDVGVMMSFIELLLFYVGLYPYAHGGRFVAFQQLVSGLKEPMYTATLMIIGGGSIVVGPGT